MIRYFLLACGAAVAALVYMSFFLALPILRFVHIPALCLVVCVLFFRRALQWWFTAILSSTLGLFSSLTFLIFPFASLIALLLIRALFEHFFTNRSIYGVTAMTAAATACLTILTSVAGLLAFNGGQRSFTQMSADFLWTGVSTVLVSIGLFYLSVLFFRGMRKNLLIRGRQRRIP